MKRDLPLCELFQSYSLLGPFKLSIAKTNSAKFTINDPIVKKNSVNFAVLGSATRKIPDLKVKSRVH